MGEALLNRDECDPAVCEHPSSNRNKQAPSQGEVSNNSSNIGVEALTVEDVSDLKFARHCVVLPGLVGGVPTSQSILASLDIERVVARTILHFHAVYNVSVFCLHVTNRPPEDLIKLHNLQTVYDTVIVLRLLNKDYRVGIVKHNSAVTSPRSVNDCIKVSYRVGNAFSLITGNETRIPLKHDEFNQVCASILFSAFVDEILWFRLKVLCKADFICLEGHPLKIKVFPYYLSN